MLDRRGGLADRCARWLDQISRLRGDLGQLLGQSPIDDERLAELAEHDVFGLEVAVDHALAVGVGDGLAHALQHGDGAGQPPEGIAGVMGADHGLEVLALHALHREVGRAPVVEADLVDGHDARVVELGQDLRLREQAAAVARAVRARRGRRILPALAQDLDRDRPVQVGVVGLEDRPHPPVRDLPARLVARAGQGGFRLARSRVARGWSIGLQQQPDPLVPGAIRERTAQRGCLHLLRSALRVVTRRRAVNDAAASELRRADRALTSPPGPLLAVRLAPTAGDLAPRLRRVRALPGRGQLGHDNLVDQRDVHLNVEHLGRKLGGAGLLAGGVYYVNRGHCQAPFAAVLTSTVPPLAPGT